MKCNFDPGLDPGWGKTKFSPFPLKDITGTIGSIYLNKVCRLDDSYFSDFNNCTVVIQENILVL